MSETAAAGPDVWGSLTVSGEVDPELVSRALGVTPTRTARRGEVRRPGAPPVKETYWYWSTTNSNELDGASYLGDILDLLDAHRADLEHLQRSHSLQVVATVNAYVDPATDAIPWVELDHNLLARITRLGIDVVFDFNLLEPESAGSERKDIRSEGQSD
jgi:hypothetical protein